MLTILLPEHFNSIYLKNPFFVLFRLTMGGSLEDGLIFPYNFWPWLHIVSLSLKNGRTPYTGGKCHLYLSWELKYE